jgi:hypothetical protein
MLILECSQGCYGRTDGSITISLRNFVGIAESGIKHQKSNQINHPSNNPINDLFQFKRFRGLTVHFVYTLCSLNATFSNISAISWQPVLVEEKAGENHRPWASNW